MPEKSKVEKSIQAEHKETVEMSDLTAEESIEEPVIKKETASEEITAKTKIKNPHSSREEQEQAVDSVAEEIKQNESVEKAEYVFPPLDLLKKAIWRIRRQYQ